MLPVAAYVWLGLAVLLGIAEAATVTLTCIWFALGALAAFVAALLGGEIWLQILVFLAVSAASLALTRPLARRYVDARKVPTNADRLMGQRARVTETIDNIAGKGAVYIDGKTWSARSENDAVIPEGTMVVVECLQGVKLTVKKEEASCGSVV